MTTGKKVGHGGGFTACSTFLSREKVKKIRGPPAVFLTTGAERKQENWMITFQTDTGKMVSPVAFQFYQLNLLRVIQLPLPRCYETRSTYD